MSSYEDNIEYYESIGVTKEEYERSLKKQQEEYNAWLEYEKSIPEEDQINEMLEKYNISYGSDLYDKVGYEDCDVAKDFPGNVHSTYFYPDSVCYGEDFYDATIAITYPKNLDLVKQAYNEVLTYNNGNRAYIVLLIYTLEKIIENLENC